MRRQNATRFHLNLLTEDINARATSATHFLQQFSRIIFYVFTPFLFQISAGALVDIAQHKPEAVVDAGAICHLVHGLENQDPKLKVSIFFGNIVEQKDQQ